MDNFEEQLEMLQNQFDKTYGEGTFSDISRITDYQQEILHTTPSLDLGLNGGLSEGSWITLTGPPKTGKSVFALTLAAEAQKQGRIIFYADVEARLKRKNLDIEGLDLSPQKFKLIRSTEEKLLSGVDFLNQIICILETIPRAMVIIDSVSSLAEKKEMEEGVEAETRGNINKKISSFVRCAGQAVTVNKSYVVGITQRIANVTGYGKSQLEKAGYAWRHQRDCCLFIKKSEPWTIEDKRSVTGLKEIGKKVTWVVEESILGAPGAEVQTYLRYGFGYDKKFEIFQLAIGLGIINKAAAGGWITIPQLSNKKIQGEEKAFNLLCSNAEVYEEINSKVMKFLTGQEDE